MSRTRIAINAAAQRPAVLPTPSPAGLPAAELIFDPQLGLYVFPPMESEAGLVEPSAAQAVATHPMLSAAHTDPDESLFAERHDDDARRAASGSDDSDGVVVVPREGDAAVVVSEADSAAGTGAHAPASLVRRRHGRHTK